MAHQIRDAIETDLPAILDITNDAIRNTTAVWSLVPATLDARRAWWRERTAAGFPVLVAVDETRVLGFASYGQFRPWEGYLHSVEHSVYVAREARRQGCARALVAALLGHATTRGMHTMIGGIEAGNAESLKLHASLGFEEVGRLHEVGRKFDRWLDLVFMQRMLAAPSL